MPKEFKWTVSRSSLLEDSYNAIMAVHDTELLKSRLYVTFQGESGLDYGGLARWEGLNCNKQFISCYFREWFYLLSHEMFNPYYGLFEYSARCVCVCMHVCLFVCLFISLYVLICACVYLI